MQYIQNKTRTSDENKLQRIHDVRLRLERVKYGLGGVGGPRFSSLPMSLSDSSSLLSSSSSSRLRSRAPPEDGPGEREGAWPEPLLSASELDDSGSLRSSSS